MSDKIDYVSRQHIQMLIANDEFEEVLKYIDKLAHSNPEEYCKWEYFRYVVEADIELEQFRHAHSICQLRTTGKKNPLDSVYQDFGDVNCAIAEKSHKAKKIWYCRALKHYLKSYSYNKNNVIVYRKIATAYEESGDIKNAVSWLSKAISKDDSYIMAYYQKSRLLERQEKYEEAIQVLKDLKKVFPMEDISFSVALILKTKGDLRGAIKEFKKGTDDDDHGFCHDEIAKCYEELKDYKNVVKTYKNMFKYCQKNQKEYILQLIGEFYLRIRQYNKAIKYFNTLLHRRNKEYSEYYNRIAYRNLTKIYYEKKIYKKSLRCAIKAKELYIKHAREDSEWGLEVLGDIVDIFVYIGNCYYSMNTHHMASIKAYKKVLYYIPHFIDEHSIEWGKNTVPKLYNTIAIQYLALNKQKLVEYYLSLEEDKQKEMPEYYMVKAELAYRNNNPDKMCEYWEMAQKIAKDTTIHKDAKARLSFLKTVASKKAV